LFLRLFNFASVGEKSLIIIKMHSMYVKKKKIVFLISLANARTVAQSPTFLHILSTSLSSNHPLIQCFTVSATDNIIQQTINK